MANWAWRCVAVVVVAAILTVHTATSNNNLDLLDDLLTTNPTHICPYVSCQEPVSADACPDGSVYMDGVAQFGCCGACVAFRKEGQKCVGNYSDMFKAESRRHPTNIAANLASLRTAEGNVVQSQLCAEGYMCYYRDNKCYPNPNASECSRMLNSYLSDLESDTYVHYRDDYRWQPSCTAGGKFLPKQCIGPLTRQRCVCMDPEGNRLYGMAFPEQEELYNTMNCKCSRQAWEKKQAGVASVTLHCLENGNYERLQCEDGWCYCIDPETAVPYGSRLPESGMHLLPCYNKTTTGQQYLRRCESQQHAHATFIQALEETGVNGPESLTLCDQDGSYNGRQCDAEMCRCYDKYKADVLSYPSGDDCQCARDREYYKNTGGNVAVTCVVSSGVYEREQSTVKYKYCVDEDGIRAGPLVLNEASYYLNCDNAKECIKNGNGALGDEGPCVLACVTQQGGCPAEAYANYEP